MGIESRILRIEKRQPSRGSLDWLTTDEIEELERAVCDVIAADPGSSPKDRAQAQTTITEIDKSRDDREALCYPRFLHGAPDDAA
jgi:hypothetical protein